MGYVNDTRKKVEKFITDSEKPLLRREIQNLNSTHPTIRWSSLNSILEDLVEEKKIITYEKKIGKKMFICVEKAEGLK